jgi:hypothetical protein
MIIDFLFDDKRALANMSLVCKAFHPSARLHLFDTLTIRSDLLLNSTRAPLSDNVETFTSFGPLVHRLLIHGTSSTDGSLHRWIDTLLPCFSVFKYVTSLSLDLCEWDLEDTENGTRSNILPCFSGLLELSFIHCTFYDTADITWLALQCPLLEQMHFEDVDSQHSPNSDLVLAQGPVKVVPSDTCSLPRLRSVALSGEDIYLTPIICWFLTLDTIPPLRNLQITDISKDELALAGQLIHALRPSLRHLRLGFFEGQYTLRLGVSR